MTEATNRRPNRLSQESSPYLLQHAHNPVDWYPWGPEALTRAKRESKPIFLSIGYSACHWCHVMEKESFEDDETAKIMNAHFINIKVDREERPDLDHIYMNAVQLMTQHGGWPMSVFLTPSLEPFYGGTYFPPDDRHGMPSFKKILNGVANAWSTRRNELTQSASQLTEALKGMNEGIKEESKNALSLSLVDRAVERIIHNFDSENGGFGKAPKFFHTMDLKVALRHHKRTNDPKSLAVVTLTLDKMLNGGIYDQLGGGFHRYSTDAAWLVPHFEKMLYDNALLTDVYLEAFQVTGQVEYARIARETLNYTLREMTSPEGGFFSTQDADSEGVEGKFYVWSKEEISKSLESELANYFCKVYNVTPRGNWEGHNILNRPKTLDHWAEEFKVEKGWLEDGLATASRKLLTERGERIAPFRDEKILTSWNGLMIHAMALGYQVLHDERYLDAARNAARFVVQKMRDPQTLALTHAHKDGRSRFNAYLDDYAMFLNGVITLLETDFSPEWLQLSCELSKTLLEKFWDDKSAGFHFTSHDHETLITRPQENHDGATPSATAMAITALARLGRLTGNADYLKITERVLTASEGSLSQIPGAMGQSLVALEFLMSKPLEMVLASSGNAEETEHALSLIRAKFLPNKVVLSDPSGNLAKDLPQLKDKKSIGQKTTLYLCEQFTCQAPIAGLEAIQKELLKR